MRDFDRHFDRTEKTIHRMWAFTAFLALLQVVFYLAVAAGIIYFIVFAITHWLKW